MILVTDSVEGSGRFLLTHVDKGRGPSHYDLTIEF